MNITRLIPIKQKQDVANLSKDLSFETISTDTKKSVENPTRDTVNISDEAKERQNYYKYLLEELERSREASESSNDSHEDYIKCLQIAMRIMGGDKVPLKDEKFLSEKQPDLYLRAILMRRTRENPKKYKSLIEDEEDDDVSTILSSGEVESSSGENSPSVDVEVSVDLEE